MTRCFGLSDEGALKQSLLLLCLEGLSYMQEKNLTASEQYKVLGIMQHSQACTTCRHSVVTQGGEISQSWFEVLHAHAIFCYSPLSDVMCLEAVWMHAYDSPMTLRQA